MFTCGYLEVKEVAQILGVDEAWARAELTEQLGTQLVLFGEPWYLYRTLNLWYKLRINEIKQAQAEVNALNESVNQTQPLEVP